MAIVKVLKLRSGDKLAWHAEISDNRLKVMVRPKRDNMYADVCPELESCPACQG